MKITTRIALALGVVTGLLVGVVAHQLAVLERVQGVNEELTDANLQAARGSVRLLQGLEGLREFAAKTLLVWEFGDPGYLERWGEWEEAVGEDLDRLQDLVLPAEEAVHRDRIVQGWATYDDIFRPLREGLVAGEATETEGAGRIGDLALLDELDDVLDPIRAATEALMAANDESAVARADEASAAVDRARTVAWIAGVGGAVLSLLLAIALYLALSGPVRRLARGTREIARGNFDHRLDTRGGTELSEVARDFNRMAGQLGEVEDMKKDFISHVSHELKGPLAAIHETVLILLERIPGPLNEKQEHLLELSHQSANRLSTMIGNLLGVSRMEAGAVQYDFHDHDVVSLSRELIEEMGPVSSDKALRLSLHGEDPLFVRCDLERLREVLANLVGNAIKFSPPDAPIRISWDRLERPVKEAPAGIDPGPCALLSVADRGPGVPDEHKRGIFEKFYQVKRHTRIHGQGVGLGLAISKKIAEAHGGAIWVEDAPRGGCVFKVLLPVVPHAARSNDGDASGPPEDGRRGRAFGDPAPAGPRSPAMG